MSRVPALVLAIALPFALAACHTAQPAPQRMTHVRMHMAGSPQDVLAQLHSDAAARGWHIGDEGPTSIFVDFGVQQMRIPVPTEYGLWGTRVVFRDTEVHASALYEVAADDKGTVVTLWNNPIYWHPDLLCWMPGPYDLSPGREMLRSYGDGGRGGDAEVVEGGPPSIDAAPQSAPAMPAPSDAAPAPRGARAPRNPPVAVPIPPRGSSDTR